MARVRQSTIGTFDVCSWREKLQIESGMYTGGISAALGTGVHGGLELYYQGRKMGSIPSLVDICEQAVVVFDEEIAKSDQFNWVYQPETSKAELKVLDREESIGMIVEILTLYFQHGWYWPEQYEILEVEYYFERDLPVSPAGLVHVATGTADLLMRNEDTGRFTMADHKTSKAYTAKSKHGPKDKPQAPYYVWAIGQEYGLEPHDIAVAFDVMSWKPKYRGQLHERFIRHPFDITQPMVDAIIWKAQLVGDAVHAGHYYPNPTSFLCSQQWCDHWERCHFGPALNGEVPVSLQSLKGQA